MDISPSKNIFSSTITDSPSEQIPVDSFPSKRSLVDRFIPCRADLDLDICRQKLLSTNSTNNENKDINDCDFLPDEQLKVEFEKKMKDVILNKEDVSSSRILSFSERSIPTSNQFDNQLQVLYSSSSIPTEKVRSDRRIPSAPVRVLDAPELQDDYYLNLISWSSLDLLAVALGQSVYLWNSSTGDIQHLTTLDDSGSIICSVSWTSCGSHIAIGTSDNIVQLWDVSALKQVRRLTGHSARIGSLAWNNQILCSGSKDTNIIAHDIRIREHKIGLLTGGHEMEVCGLVWSPDGFSLASGGNDNRACLWDMRFSHERSFNEIAPRIVLSEHQAAVKALAWCPFQSNLLASGGGTADRSIKFWNTTSGTCINSLDTGSQVSALQWSVANKELVSAHGFSQNQLCIWKYPQMSKVKELTGHTGRILNMAMSPNGTTVVTAAADETLRFWDICGADVKVQKKVNEPASTVTRNRTIR